MVGVFNRCNILANQHKCLQQNTLLSKKEEEHLPKLVQQLCFWNHFWPFVSHHVSRDYETRSSTGAEFIQGEEGRDKKLNKQIIARTAVQRHKAHDSLSQVKRFMWGTNDIIATLDGGGREIGFRKLQFTFQNIKYIQTS